MSEVSKSVQRKSLQKSWSRWTAIVDLFARRRPARSRVDSAAYLAIHRDLINDLRALTESADAEEQAYLRDLEMLASPWLNLKSLARTDREILENLLMRCRTVEHELGGRNG